jgi:competence protein ComEC
LREFFTNRIYTVIYESSFEPHVKSMLLALLTGDKSMLGNDLYKLLVSAGLIHLFVVSGLHISLIFTLTFFLAQALLRVGWLLRFPVQPLAVIFAGSAAVFYGFITGLEVPALRAVFSVCCISWLAWQMGSITLFRLWVLACVFVLLLKPVAFIGLGAQLSFGVVLAFTWALSGRKTFWLSAFLLLQFAAFSAGAILLAAANLPVPLAGLLLNMVFIPLVSLLVLPLAVMYLLIGVCGVELSGLTWLLNELLSIPLGLLAGQPWPVVQVSHLKFWPFVVCLLLLLAPRFLGVRPIAITVLVVLLWAPIPSPLDWQLHVFDVGQGSAQLVQVAGRNILIDTGDRYLSGTRVADFTIVPALRYLGVERLDMLLVTHHDADHSGGVDSILEAGLLQGPVLNEDNCQGAQWRIATVSFQVFQVQGLTGNNHSCVLSIESPYGSALLPGDIERKSELLLAAQLDHRDVLLVPHHGSKTSSSALFLDKIAPNVAIISVGAANRYGHPHHEVISRLSGRGLSLLSTASHGAVSLSFSPRQAGPSVSTYRPDFYPLVEE